MPVQADILGSFADKGFAGLMVAMLACFIYFLIKEHRSERKEWLDTYNQQIDKSIAANDKQARMADERQSETNTVLRELITVFNVANERQRRFD